MLCLALLLCAPLAPQTSRLPEEPPSVEQLVEDLGESHGELGEAAAEALLASGVEALTDLPDLIVRYRERFEAGDASFEALERVEALRMMIAAGNQDAFEILLEQAGDSRNLVRISTQHALAALPENPAPELIQRWTELRPVQRENCVFALAMGGTAAAHDQLVAIVNGQYDDTSAARMRAAMGLRQFAPRPDALAALEKVAAEPWVGLARGACTTLWGYGEPGVLGLVAAQSHWNQGVVGLASALLADLGPVAKGPVLEALMESPRHLHLLRVACCIAPEDSTTQLCFLNLRGVDDLSLQRELVRSVPELELDTHVRIEVLGEALVHADPGIVTEAALSCLRIPEHELLALRDVLMLAWALPGAEREPLMAMAGAILRMKPSPEELLDWCDERMTSPGEVGRDVAGLLAGTLADTHPELVIQRVRHTLTAKQVHWLPHIVGRDGPADELLLELVQAARPDSRPRLLRQLAATGSSDKEVISTLRLALADSHSRDFLSVLEGLSTRGIESKVLSAAVLKPFNDLRPQRQALALWAASRCHPDSKRVFAAAKRALAESPSDEVRASAALVLARGTSSKGKRITLLQEALERRGQPIEGARESDPHAFRERGASEILDVLLTDLRGPKTVGAIASALASLECDDPTTIDALGDCLEGELHQAMTVSESLRELNRISANGSANLTTLMKQSHPLIRTSVIRALVEIEGASVHADVTLSLGALVLDSELSAMALNGLEALTPNERPFSAPYLKCVAARTDWPLTGVGWKREAIDLPFAHEFEWKGALVPNVAPLKRLGKTRHRAAALLAKEN